MELVFALAKSGHPIPGCSPEQGIYSKRTGNARVWQTEHAQWSLCGSCDPVHSSFGAISSCGRVIWLDPIGEEIHRK